MRNLWKRNNVLDTMKVDIITRDTCPPSSLRGSAELCATCLSYSWLYLYSFICVSCQASTMLYSRMKLSLRPNGPFSKVKTFPVMTLRSSTTGRTSSSSKESAKRRATMPFLLITPGKDSAMLLWKRLISPSAQSTSFSKIQVTFTFTYSDRKSVV